MDAFYWYCLDGIVCLLLAQVHSFLYLQQHISHYSPRNQIIGHMKPLGEEYRVRFGRISYYASCVLHFLEPNHKHVVIETKTGTVVYGLFIHEYDFLWGHLESLHEAAEGDMDVLPPIVILRQLGRELASAAASQYALLDRLHRKLRN